MKIKDLKMKDSPVMDHVKELLKIDQYPFSVLSEKQLAFVLYIHHGPYLAAAKAGYTKPADAWQRLKKSGAVQMAIQIVRQYIVDISIADSTEVLQTWTEILRDPKNKAADRLNAGKLLAQAHGMLSDKLIIERARGLDDGTVVTISGTNKQLKIGHNGQTEVIDADYKPLD